MPALRRLPAPKPARTMALATALCAVCVVLSAPAPAASEVWRPGLTHSVEGRFGVSHMRDRTTGLSETRPLAEARYTATWRVQTDNGWRVAASFGIEAGTPLGGRARPEIARR
jgi:hypothetical protein